MRSARHYSLLSITVTSVVFLPYHRQFNIVEFLPSHDYKIRRIPQVLLAVKLITLSFITSATISVHDPSQVHGYIFHIFSTYTPFPDFLTQQSL